MEWLKSKTEGTPAKRKKPLEFLTVSLRSIKHVVTPREPRAVEREMGEGKKKKPNIRAISLACMSSRTMCF